MGKLMKDGYYLSTYVTVDALAHLVPLDQRHDSNIALFKKNGHNIELIHYWELERLTRLKHHSRAFYNKEHAEIFINDLLKPYGLTMEDMEEVWGTPQLQTTDDYHSINEYPHLMFHSIAHLFSGLLLDSDIFNNYDILALAVDGVPDHILQASSNKDYYSAAYASSGKVIDLFTVSSPGNLWSFAKDHFKLQEGSLMALASASTSKAFFPQLDTLVMKNAKTIMESGKLYFDRLIQFISNLEPSDSGTLFNHYDTRFSVEENHISMVMKEIQQMSIRMLEREIDEIMSKYAINPQKTYLSITGGYALNCPTNSYLMNKYGFKGFIAPPCVNDSGISLGIGLYAFYKKMHPSALNFKLSHAFYGDEQTNTTVEIGNHKYQSFIKETEPFSITKIVEDIINYPIVWFNGRAEIGPRALGNRSLLGDPRHQKTKKILNEIKQRQWWRPVAPIIIESEVKNWFENSSYSYSPYMLHTYNILPNKASLIPAVAHLDRSARVQTINSKSNTLLYKIINKFYKETGVPILCNTSLNDKNEPIINTIEETIIFALRKNIPVIYINGVRIALQNHGNYQSENINTKFELFTEREREQLFKQMNPHQIPIESLSFYKQVIENNMKQKYDLTNHKEVKRLLREIQLYNR